MSETQETKGIRLSWGLNSATVLGGGALAVTLIVWLVTSQNKSAEAQRNLEQLHQAMTAQIAELGAATTSGLADVRRQIESLPGEKAQLADLQRRVGQMAQEASAARAVLDARLGVAERATIELRADLNNLVRASSMPPPQVRR